MNYPIRSARTPRAAPPLRDSFTWAPYTLILTSAILQGGVGGMLPFLTADFGMSHTLKSPHITAMASGGLGIVAALMLASASSPAWSIPALALAGI